MGICAIYVSRDRLKSKCQLSILRNRKNSEQLYVDKIYLSFGMAGIYKWKQKIYSGQDVSKIRQELAGQIKLTLLEAAALLQDAWTMNQFYQRVPPIGLQWLFALLDMNTDRVNHQELLLKLVCLPKEPEEFINCCIEAMLRLDLFFCYDLSDKTRQELLGPRKIYILENLLKQMKDEIIRIYLEKIPGTIEDNNQMTLQLIWHDAKENIWFGQYLVKLVRDKDIWLLEDMQEQGCRQLSIYDPLHPRNKHYTCNVYQMEEGLYNWLVKKLACQSILSLQGESEHCQIYHEIGDNINGNGASMAVLSNELWLYGENAADLSKAKKQLNKLIGSHLQCVGKCHLPLWQIEKAASAGESLQNMALTLKPPLVVFDLDNLESDIHYKSI